MRQLLNMLALAFDAKDTKDWMTANGTHIPLDDDGKPTGKVGEKIKESTASKTETFITGNELGSYSNSQELRQKAKKYYQKNLQGKPIERSDIGAIRISGKGFNETKSFSANPDKLLLLPALPDILKTGRLGEEEKLDHARKDGIVSFLPITKTVTFKGEPREVEALVGKDRSGNLYYDLFLDGSRQDKKSSGSGVKQNSRLPEDIAKDIKPFAALNISFKPSCVKHDRLAFDRASRRHMDENGFLHVSMNHISKEVVNEYYGHEIPGWQDLGLDPQRIYKGYRSGIELAKGAETFNGLPLLSEHIKDSAAAPQKDYRIGNLGTDAEFKAPYLNNSLIIQDAEAIELLNPSDPDQAPKRELSASYRYDPIFKRGEFNGEYYDFIMTNIRGNHVAIVEEGRAGADVAVADGQTINTKRGKNMGFLEKLKALLMEEMNEQDAPAVDNEVAESTAEEKTPEAIATDNDPIAKLAAYAEKLDEAEAAILKKAIAAVQASEVAGDEDPEKEKPAEDSDPEGEEKDKAAMDKKSVKKTPHVVVALDAATITKNVRADLQAQIEAARAVRPLIGDVDPMAFDSAAGIYAKALELAGRPTKVKDLTALKELVALASDAKPMNITFPVLEALAEDSKGEGLAPEFANVLKIRKA